MLGTHLHLEKKSDVWSKRFDVFKAFKYEYYWWISFLAKSSAAPIPKGVLTTTMARCLKWHRGETVSLRTSCFLWNTVKHWNNGQWNTSEWWIKECLHQIEHLILKIDKTMGGKHLWKSKALPPADVRVIPVFHCLKLGGPTWQGRISDQSWGVLRRPRDSKSSRDATTDQCSQSSESRHAPSGAKCSTQK